ncbi:GTPase [Nocardioides cynanchi]|uniref:GTPase n=1 Tax=Nocardioides cynanchi TaxID=2558918 RepID=UPI001EE390EF|nr:GTPase [Nocardioides cynanchi]
MSRGSDLGDRIDGLGRATAAARGRLPDPVVDEAEATVGRATHRLGLTADHTVVALAGATGSGKSSTFNALAGVELSSVGVRRPTTSWATACVWGKAGADELLEWLGIAPRHQVMRDSLLDLGKEDSALQGVVLLDLPDHDSTEVSHHLEVNRLIELTDLMVWVLDPQKYADAAVHDRYLAPFASHKDVMLVVLNHIDEVPEDRRQAMLDDVRRLVDADGLDGVPVLATSARTGEGIDALRSEIQRRVKAKSVTRSRIQADLKDAATRLQEASGTSTHPALSKERIAALEDAFADAAGVPTVVAAVESATRLRAGRATGWPVTSWISRLRPDPLRRLHLDLGEAGKEFTRRGRTSVPAATSVQRARVDSEVRAVADEVSAPLARPWADAVRRASVSRLPDLNDRLDSALAGTELDADRIPVWAGAVRLLQWVLLLAALVGLGWLGVLAGDQYLSGSNPSAPEVGGFLLPTALLLGGVILGVLLALACRLLVSATARSRARTADRRLREAISRVADELVVAPVRGELAAYDTVREGLAGALK